MVIEVIDIQKNKTGTVEAPEKVFGAKWNADLVHQAMVTLLANRRQPWAHAKDRSEVAGGGKKPWKQKGTGRSRHGSIRSPLWAGGGVTHGPLKERYFSKKLNAKMRRAAVASVLSRKLKEGEITVVDSFSHSGKAKEWAKSLSGLADLRSKNLLVFAKENAKSARAVSNIKNIDTLAPESLNVFDLLKNKNVIIESEAIKQIAAKFKA